MVDRLYCCFAALITLSDPGFSVINRRYIEIIQKQRLEFEELLSKRLRQQEDESAKRTRIALEEKESSISKLINSALEEQREQHESDAKEFEELTTNEIRTHMESEYEEKLEQYKRGVKTELAEKINSLQVLSEKVAHLEASLAASESSKEGSFKAHRLSAAALALTEKLETNQDALNELNALKSAAGNDGVIAAALATIPNSAKSGVPTTTELQSRFEVVYQKGREAALVPVGSSGLEGQIVGMLFATTKGSPGAKDLPVEDNAVPEHTLVRAREHVQRGDLEKAVEELEMLQGQTAFTVADWKKAALSRVAVEKALKVIKMECALLNESLVSTTA